MIFLLPFIATAVVSSIPVVGSAIAGSATTAAAKGVAIKNDFWFS